jgi:hypothetical protein
MATWFGVRVGALKNIYAHRDAGVIISGAWADREWVDASAEDAKADTSWKLIGRVRIKALKEKAQ